jgi:mono/diheme cytochrome c family protein
MPRARIRWIVTLVLVLLVAIAAVASRGRGLSARRAAWPGEERLARFARAWTLPAEYRGVTNPVAPTAAALRAGMEHWADHCATCHGNDGSGQVPVGRGLFPPAPDMRTAATQRLSDGALFYAIEEGIPFTGMPAWSTGTGEGQRESWELVLFIRHLPRITPAELEEMETLNPRSPADMEQERQIQEFLKGGGS